jgi:D-lactate dehydrogenase (cytochrome)
MIKKMKSEFSEDYLVDASNYKGEADILYIPEDTNELKEIIKDCYSKNIKMTISASRTGLTGASVPLEGAVISTEKLNRIISIDNTRQKAILEPGVIIQDFQDEIKQHGFFYAPNPTEQNSTIGGNVSTAASGARTFKYGTTRDFVSRIDIILPNGEELILKRGEDIEKNGFINLKSQNGNIYSIPIKDINMPNVKHAAGYYVKKNMDAIDLFIGSEGTLGVVKEIEVGIVNIPERVMGGLVFFKNVNEMLKFVDIVRDKSIINNTKSIELNDDLSARLIELFDNNSLRLLREKFQEIPENSVGAIWFEQEYSPNHEEILLDKWYDLIKKHTKFHYLTWMALDDAGHRKLMEFRHELPLGVFELIKKYDSIKIGTDSAVSSKYLHYYYNLLKESLDDSGLTYFVWGHIGNTHFHANILSRNDEELKKGYQLYEKFLSEAIRLGGTVSAEHGIGKLKKDYLMQLYGSEIIEYMVQIKLTLDNKNLLGYGNLF